MKISEYPQASEIQIDDFHLISNPTDKTRKIKVSGEIFSRITFIIEEAQDPIQAVGLKRKIFRGKYLGATVTSDQYAAIKSGLFTDLFLGDYWTINNVNHRIADFDYWLRTGDNTECTDHHLVIVPDHTLYSDVMNDSNISTGAYVNSKMYTTNLASAKTTINAAFPNHVLSHREYLQNATNASTPGYPTAGAWLDSTVELMNESMVYGADILRARGTGQLFVNNVTVEHHQLALFKENPRFITIRETYWLRDIVSSASFAHVDYNGAATDTGASASRGVRPVFGIKGE